MQFLLIPEIREILKQNYNRTGKTGLRTFWDYDFRHNGRIIEARRSMPNIFHDDGEELICKIVFDETVSVPASYYIGLDARVSAAEDDTLASEIAADEEDGTGYAREAVASDNTDWTVSFDATDWQALSHTVTFTAGAADWQTNTYAFLTDQASAQSGKYLICSQALSTGRLLGNGDSLNVSLAVKIKEAA